MRHINTFSALALASLLLSSAQATQLRLYPNFAELKQPLVLQAGANNTSAGTLNFTGNSWNLIHSGSFNV